MFIGAWHGFNLNCNCNFNRNRNFNFKIQPSTPVHSLQGSEKLGKMGDDNFQKNTG